ncbi:LacI family DNA-binding transcriptional regulator [Prauserella shujinwangii]|uniref:LacI family DNA-binding transcriptional regulator n=1 Tax=Prauserella shujinwangii TaxID=1453103 RepID=UPI000D0626B3|nr:LacI family DNA-binding transcriptional regulator [Prauserella shujinwangii]
MRGGQGERPRLEHVAARAGVSRSTASRALGGGGYVSSRARRAVLAAADELGYSPNQAARSLVTRRTGAVALVLSEPEERVLDDPYFAAVIRAAFRELAAVGGQLLVMFVDSAGDVPNAVRFLDGGHVDGALVFAPHRADPLPGALGRTRLPVVFGGSPGSGSRGRDTVDFDNEAGARLAVDHLVERGRRRIATISGPADHAAGIARLAGWRAAVAAHRAGDAELVEEGDFTLAGGERAMRRLLDRRPDLDAVFAASDPTAAGALRALRAAGRRVPEDVAVVGFDDHPTLAPALSPPLTSVHQDPRDQVREMVAMLRRLRDGARIRARHRILPVSLVRRESA